MHVNTGADTMHEDTDYSSFEYQYLNYSLRDATLGNESNPNVNAIAKVPVLEGTGGLDNNEIAELVGLEVSAHIEYEDGANDQNVASSTEFRGVVGANLPAAETGVEIGSITNNPTPGEIVRVGAGSESDYDVSISSKADDRVFQMFRVDSGPPFDDQTNGPGGTGGRDHWYSFKNFRNMVGRGPVLDANDDMAVYAKLTSEDIIISNFGKVRVACIWDVAETDEAGRAFSVPDGM